MPSESVPWDRKEVLLKDRKQERGVGSDVVGGVGDVGGGSCSTSRWREPYLGLRDCHRASPRRPLTGHCRYDIGYQQLYHEESSGHGCTPSSSGDKFFLEEENFKPCSEKSGDVRNSTSGGRESRGSSWRSPSLDSSSDCTRQHRFSPVTAQRSVTVPITYTLSSSTSPIPSKNIIDKSDGSIINGLGTGQRCDRDHSLGSISWKPLKWTRPSGFSLSKAVRPDSEEASLAISMPQMKDSPVNSPATSNFPSDDRGPSKKPRLGWGQGLAKYEKQKVEGVVDVSGQNGSLQTVNNCKDFLCDSTSPKFSAAIGSVSPSTPTSATCTSYPGCTDENLSVKVLNAETDKSQCSESFAFRLHHSSENISINLDRLDANSMSTLDLLLTDLMQPEEICSGDSTINKNSTLNKLLVLKKDISKELEKTECEIDLFENKLKSINCDTQINNYQKCTFITQGADVQRTGVKSVDATFETSSPEKCILASSAGLEVQSVAHTHLSDEHVSEAQGNDHNSPRTIICDAVQLDCSESDHTDSILDCSEGMNVYSRSLQTDKCLLNNKDDKTEFLDAEPMVNDAMRLPADICCSESALHVDNNRIFKNMYGSSIALIIASNKNAAKSASKELDLAMPPGISQFNLWESDKILQCRNNYMHIKRKLALKKCISKFKERFLTLKFRALHHLWREDLNLLTLRKNRPKSNKRFEINSRSPQLTLQKNRSSARSRHALPADNLTIVPTTEIINFTSKLLSDSQLRLYRNNLKMPAQIIDESDRRYSRFKSNNGLIEDPSALEKERTMMNPWMHDEKNIFLEMLATFGKDFKKISSFILHKTTADCVEFYYKNHKSESFTEAKRKLKLRKQWQSRHSNTYLITSGSRFNREANASSLELLSSASLIAAESNCSKRNNQKQSGKIPRRINGSLEKSNGEISGSEKEAAAADVLAGICGALSSDAMSSCVTSSIDLPEKLHLATVDHSLTPEAAHHTIDEDDESSGESSDEMESADWTDEEKSLFIRAFNMYGKDFLKVAHFVRTRSRDQCKIFFSKARKCLGLDVIQPGSTNGVTPSDANEGRSGTDDACSTQSCSKMDVDFTQSMLETCREGHANASITTHEHVADRLCVECEIDASIPDEAEGKFDGIFPLNEDNLLIKGGDAHIITETFVDPSTTNENAGNMSSAGKPIVELKVEEEDKLQVTAEAVRKECDVDSSQLIVLLDPVVESRPQVKLEENGTVDDPFFVGRTFQSNENHCNGVEQKNSDFPNHVLSSNFEHQMPLDLLCPLKGPHTKVVKPETAVSIGSNFVLPDFSSISFNKDDKKPSIAIVNFQDGGKCKQESISGDLLAQDSLKTPFANPMSPLLIAANSSMVLSQGHNSIRIKRKMFDEKSTTDIHATTNGTSQVIHSQGDPSSKFEDQSHRVGDLKLFGQILSHPSSQKVCSTQEDAKANMITDSSTTWKDAVVFSPILGSKDALSYHRGEFPQKTYGFWDGNRIQTGFSSLPESAITLDKYQVSTSFRTNTNSEYQQQTQMQSACTETKFLDTFPADLHKRNKFDVISGFQQQRRMVQLGVNMVGAGVSDPVAALQMHYSGRAKILTSDHESLTGNMG